ALTHYVNPDLEKFQKTHILTVTVDPATCQLHAPWNIPTLCDAARDALTKGGLSFTTAEGPRGSLPTLKIEGPSGTRTVESTGGGGWAATNPPQRIARLHQARRPTQDQTA